VQPVAHFVIDTSRNGNGPNDMSAYAAAPHNQPPSVISGLRAGNWCNPPGAALGQLPQAVPRPDTFPLLDVRTLAGAQSAPVQQWPAARIDAVSRHTRSLAVIRPRRRTAGIPPAR
jgi:Glycosyl hydrolases family 6